MCWVELARLWGGWWNISVVIFVMDGPTDQPILLLQDTDEADWSSSYLVNFSSRLLTIISSSRILSSFSVLATGDLVSFLNSHRSSFLGCSNLTSTHQRRSRVWILWANVSVPEDKEGLPPEKNFFDKPSEGLIGRHFVPLGQTQPRGPVKNEKWLYKVPKNTFVWKSNFYLQIIPDIAFVVHVQLVILKYACYQINTK